MFGFHACGVICNAIWEVYEEHRNPQLANGRYPRRTRKASSTQFFQPKGRLDGIRRVLAGCGLLRDFGTANRSAPPWINC